MCRHDRFQFGHEFPLTTERQIRVDPGFECRKPTLLKPRDLALRPRLQLQIGERIAPEESQRLLQTRGCLLRGRSRRGAHKLVEPVSVNLARRDHQLVAALARHHPTVAERFAQLRHVHLHALQRRLRGRAIPDLFDQMVGRNRPAPGQQQEREKRALLHPSQRDHSTAVLDLERAKYPKLHYVLSRPPPAASLSLRNAGFTTL